MDKNKKHNGNEKKPKKQNVPANQNQPGQAAENQPGTKAPKEKHKYM